MSSIEAREDTFMAKIVELAMATHLEVFLFFTAVLAYFALFGNVVPHSSSSKSKVRTKHSSIVEQNADETEDDMPPLDGAGNSAVNKKDVAESARAFRNAFDIGDYRAVLREWSMLKCSQAMPSISLSHAVESMQRCKKDSAFILREIEGFLNRYSQDVSMSAINDLFESLSRRMDSELMQGVVAILPAKLAWDSRTYEIFLAVSFTSRQFHEVQKLIAEMKANHVDFTARATVVAIKTALKLGHFEAACRSFRSLKSMSIGPEGTISQATRHIVSQLVEMACKEHRLADLLPELREVPISEEAVGLMLQECTSQRRATLALEVEKLARTQGVVFTDRLYGLFLRALGGQEVRHGERLFDEALELFSHAGADFIHAALGFCTSISDVARADKLWRKMKPKQASLVACFVRFFAEQEQYEKACDIYETELQSAHGCAERMGGESSRPCFLDVRLERSLMTAAFRCGRTALATKFLECSPSDVAKHISMVKNCAVSGNLEGAVEVFETLKRSGTELNSVVYNTVLDACVECRKLEAAEAWMAKTKEAGMADVVSYNTLIKAHLADGNYQKARAIMEQMKRDGHQPNKVTFNELINCAINKRSSGGVGRSDVWSLIKEMQAAGIKPNQVTCSILMKSLNSNSHEEDVMKAMELLNYMEEPMDEVLLSSVVEACVRIGKPDLLAAKLRHLNENMNLVVHGSHTFGSLIKAYGVARDIEGVWRCWKEMRSRHIRPTSITLGCMVEAVVSNGDTEGAFELIHQMQDDDRYRDALNSVIYCSVLKGFSREKRIDRTWEVYEEMSARNVELSIVTYNTLIDACARCNRMDRVPSIVKDMEAAGIQPNVITYSTMLKGHCQMGDVSTGFKILETMRKKANIKPDEIAYNSLLDGCAQRGFVEEGLSVIAGMQNEGVAPSNFTLSLVVKLMSRAKRLDTAFSLVDDISTKYRFKLNVHVYTNLIQACISNRSFARAMSTFERMIKARIHPENRTYAILIRASIQHGVLEQTAGLLRGALKLPGVLPFPEEFSSFAACPRLETALVNEGIMGLALNKDLALSLIASIKQHRPDVRVEPTTQRHVMMQPAENDGAPPGRLGKERFDRGSRGATGSRREANWADVNRDWQRARAW